jgi:hypothetical protein
MIALQQRLRVPLRRSRARRLMIASAAAGCKDLLRCAIRPVARPPFVMGDRNDEDLVAPNQVED